MRGKVEKLRKLIGKRPMPVVVVVYDGQDWAPSEEEKRRAVEEARKLGMRVAVIYAPPPPEEVSHQS